MSPTPPEPPPFSDSDEWCQHHAVSGKVCGGPHRVVQTDLGAELLNPREQPLGTPVSEMTEEEQQAHMEAEAEAQRDAGDNGDNT